MTKKKTGKTAAEAVVQETPDPRLHVAPDAAGLQRTLQELEVVLADLPKPEQPQPPDFYEAMLHIFFAEGLPCGIGQEARRRLQVDYVDRNEFRVTEAYEVEDLLRDLQIPDLFERCLQVRETVTLIYNDQNGLKLDFLRDAGVGDRNNFFVRVPAMPPFVVHFLNNLLTVDELCFSDKSTLRSQQRLGVDPKAPFVQQFLDKVRALVAPFGHLPLDVGKHGNGKPNLKHPLSPACLLARLAPPGKKR